MAQLTFVPDWEDVASKIKVKERTPAPFVDDALTELVSTYESAYRGDKMAVRQPIKPTLAYPWKEAARNAGGGPTRSTAQDSFQQAPSGFSQLPSCKPMPHWASTPNAVPLSTTSQGAYMPLPYAKRQPIVPQSRPLNDAKFDTRPTTLDAFRGMGAGTAKRQPIIPRQKSEVFAIDVAGGAYDTTSRASYVSHSVMPYVPAIKPKGTLDHVG